jgi:carboxyl-terminal processing protease
MKTRLPTLLLVMTLAVPAFAARPSPQDTLYEQIRHNIGLFGDVYREITLKYVDSVDPQKFIRAGIDGMLSTLDPYTVFMDAEGSEDLDVITSGKYGGVGLEIGVRGKDKILTVISAMDDSPAQRVGMRSGDRIMKIDSHSAVGVTTAEAAKLLRGAPGSQVTINVERTGSTEPIDFVVTRREIDIKDVPYAGFIKPGVGYVKLAHFSRRAAESLEESINKLKGEGMQSLVLDLRGNPGGLLSAAVSVTQRFCKKGDVVVSVRGRGDDEGQTYKLLAEPVAGDVPLAVLVDGGSASASEIVAGAIQDLDRGVIIGEPTFGKGLVQSVVAFETGEALKLTTAKYFTPSGRLIQKVDYFGDHQDVVLEDPKETQKHFTTRNGRPVEGGGGITPDVNVPAPRPGALGTDLWRQGTFFDFINEYRTAHPNLTASKLDDAALQEFHAWLVKTNFRYDVDGQAPLDSLRKMIADAGLADSAAVDFAHLERVMDLHRAMEFEEEKEFIRNSLEQELAVSLWGSTARIEATFDDDQQIKKAVDVLASRQEYNQLLAVENNGARTEH